MTSSKMSMTEGGEYHAGAAVSMHRSEELLCHRGMRCPWPGSHDHKSGRSGSGQVGKYDLLSLVENV